MAWRNGHGAGSGTPRIEVRPADELPTGVAAPLPATAEALERRPNGMFTPASAKKAGAAGGRARRRKPSAIHQAKKLGLGRLISQFAKDTRIEPFVTESEKWMVATLEDMSRDIGGGKLSAEVVSIVQTAAWQRCFSKFLFDLATRSQFAWLAEKAPATDPADNGKLRLQPNLEIVGAASRLGDSSRQNVLAAFELATREAEARANRKPLPGTAYDLAAALAAGTDTSKTP